MNLDILGICYITISFYTTYELYIGDMALESLNFDYYQQAETLYSVVQQDYPRFIGYVW